MKNYCMLLLIGLLSLGSCKKEDPTQKNTNMTLTGDWYMTDWLGFMQPEVYTYGDVVWSFDQAAQTVRVQNNNSSSRDFQSSGVYAYTSTSTVVTITWGSGYNQSFDYSFANGEMTLSDSPELDGPILKFKR